MVTKGITNKPKEYKKPDLSKYKEGKFSHRTGDDSCARFGGACPVNRLQRDPEEDVCLTFCIPERNDSNAREKNAT